MQMKVPEKLCRACGKVRPASDFHLHPNNKTDGLQSRCKQCNNDARRQRRKTNPDLERDRHLRYTFGITLSEYNHLLTLQGGRCKICGSQEPGDKRMGLFSLDHDHTTGKQRGLLCVHCNHGLGGFRDNIANLQAAVGYLREAADVPVPTHDCLAR